MRTPAAHSLSLMAWRVLLLIAAVLAGIWVWAMPGGFPVDHTRFWANRAAPVAVIAVAGIGWFALWKGRPGIYLPITLAATTAWSSAICCGVFLFPVSARRIVWPALAVAAVLWLLFGLTIRQQRGSRYNLALALIAAVLCGGAFPWTQRGGEPSTQPMNMPLPAPIPGGDLGDVPGMLPLGSKMQFNPYAADARVRSGSLTIDVQPLLTFESRSPDRCWTIFAPLRDRVGPLRKLTGVELIPNAARLGYQDDALHVLEMRAPSDGLTQIEAWSELNEPIFSHLNSFCTLMVHGHQQLAVSFSPCPDAIIDVLPSDYPVGRPVRLAYLDAMGVFHVAQANSGEKGPFHDLAAGALGRDKPLQVTLWDAGSPVCRLTLADWARQCGVDLSPTAGWGLPVNAIEFSRLGEPANATVGIWISLAGTSIGRGWDSVGHARGTYRNRMTFEKLSD